MFFAYYSNYKIIFLITVSIILILTIIVALQAANRANFKNKLKNTIERQEREIAERNKLISQQKTEIEFLKLKLKKGD